MPNEELAEAPGQVQSIGQRTRVRLPLDNAVVVFVEDKLDIGALLLLEDFLPHLEFVPLLAHHLPHRQLV
jgi:hypothetical protein